MFSWSRTSQYPASRMSNGGTTMVAQPIQGTVRPPTQQQHLDSYTNNTTLKQSTRRIDDSTYDTVFQTTTKETLILRVYFPPAASLPSMTLVGIKAKHAWLDSNTTRVTGYPALQSASAWQRSNVMLGTAVHEVIQHFQLNPPRVLEITDQGLKKVQGNFSSGAATTASSSASSKDAPPEYNSLSWTSDNVASPRPVRTQIDMPPLPTTFSLLDDKSRDELQKLIDNQVEFMAFCNLLPSMQTLQTMKISVLDESEKLAKRNLEKEASYNRLQEQVESLQTQLQQELERFSKLEKEQNELCVETDAAQLVQQLNKAKKQAFEESEEFADEWVEGDSGMSVDTFLKEFIAKRSVHHERAAKVEILQHHGHE